MNRSIVAQIASVALLSLYGCTPSTPGDDGSRKRVTHVSPWCGVWVGTFHTNVVVHGTMDSGTYITAVKPDGTWTGTATSSVTGVTGSASGTITDDGISTTTLIVAGQTMIVRGRLIIDRPGHVVCHSIAYVNGVPQSLTEDDEGTRD